MRTIKWCECSRCKLYLRASSELGDLDYHSIAALKNICFEDRKYQTALIEYAKDHNIIGCLPTGSGKTFIALKLVEHFKPVILLEKKKVFFLANTIPLVNQQAAFIARNCNLKVRHITGDMGVDYWNEKMWQAIFDEFDVIGMTSQIFLNMIRHGYIQFSQVVLLIFDECHHAMKDHPMCHVMKEYMRVKSLERNYPLPRVLGLTATIIQGNCKPHEVPTKVKELEETMQSVALTYKDYEEVLKHSTSAIVQPRKVYTDYEKYMDKDIIEQLESLSSELGKFRKERKNAKYKGVKLPPSCQLDNLYNLEMRKPSPGDLKVALDDVLHAYKELGLYCTTIAINLRLAFIEFSLMDINDQQVKGWYWKVQKLFKELNTKFFEIMDRFDEKRRVTEFISPKLESLVQILNQYKQYESSPVCEFGSNDSRLCGLVFTDRRATAQVLAWYLKDLALHSGDQHGFIKANFVVGTSRSAFESVESRVYARKQTETLNKFRQKELNLLTATSVLEEGIDVPSCNLVVRFDPVKTYTSYIQSMGRARKKGATFFALLPELDYYKNVAKLDEFKEINERIIAHLQANVEKIDAGDHTIEEILERDLIPPICPGGTADSPKITIDSAYDVVDRYCMLLPCDGISTLQTLSWWTVDRNECPYTYFVTLGEYQATLKMPLNGLVKGSIVGPKMQNKVLAKQAAYMEAAQRLLDAGAFDEKLVPVHPTYLLPVQKFFTDLVPSLNNGDGVDDGSAGPTDVPVDDAPKDKETDNVATPSEFQMFRKEWYSKRQPKLLTEIPLLPNKVLYVYRIIFEMVEERETSPWKNLYNLKKSPVGNGWGFGILSSQKLPNIGIFPLYGTFGKIHCSLEVLPFKEFKLDSLKLETLQSIQHQMFCDILGLQHPILGNVKEFSFLVVPLVQEKGTWVVRDVVRELNGLESIQKTKPPVRPRGHSAQRMPGVNRRPNYEKFKVGSIVFPWYKRPKPVYLVEEIKLDMNPLSPFHDGLHSNYKNFLESQNKNVKLKIQDTTQPMLICKLTGIAIGRAEKDPIQLNYFLEKYAKEDEHPVYLVPELCYVVDLPATFLIQLKLIPSFLHRFSRLLLAQEVLAECSAATGWPNLVQRFFTVDMNELSLMSSAQKYQKEEAEEGRKRRIQMREEKLRPKKRAPVPLDKIHIEQRELHYEFIHPNIITSKDVKLFHEAVSTQHSARKLTLATAEVEVVSSDLSLASNFELEDINSIQLDTIDKPLNEAGHGPTLLAIMEALSFKFSNEGVSNFGRLQNLGSSFMNFAVSLFAYCNFPLWGEPLLCQLRNWLLSLQVVHAYGKQSGMAELLSGSDFNPGASWLPPGKQILNPHLGEIAAASNVHINIFDELLTSKDKRIPEMSKEELEKFASEKKSRVTSTVTLTSAGVVVVSGDEVPNNGQGGSTSTSATGTMNQEPTPSTSSAPSIPTTQNRGRGAGQRFQKPQAKKPIFSIKHATFTHTELADFDIANGLNGIVGAFFNHSGPAGAYKALEWLGVNVPDIKGESCLMNDLERTSNPSDNTNQENALNPDALSLFVQFESVENVIQYKFKDKELLLRAFTHPTYPSHNLTECYQRLEFLGDGILGGGYTPDDLQDIRYALVNKVTYASLAVRNGFHKHLLSMSKSLTDMIDNFVVYQESVEHHVVGHFTLVSDEECWGPKHIEVPKVLGDIWEALAGAIYIDSGKSLDVVWRVFYRLMQYEIDSFCEKKPKAPIRELKAFAEKENIELKFQRNTGKTTQARGRERVKVDIGPYGSYFGAGTTKSRAKDAAAKLAWKLIKEETDFIKDRDATKIMLMC